MYVVASQINYPLLDGFLDLSLNDDSSIQCHCDRYGFLSLVFLSSIDCHCSSLSLSLSLSLMLPLRLRLLMSMTTTTATASKMMMMVVMPPPPPPLLQVSTISVQLHWIPKKYFHLSCTRYFKVSLALYSPRTLHVPEIGLILFAPLDSKTGCCTYLGNRTKFFNGVIGVVGEESAEIR